VAAVIVVALALVILRPFPGDSHLGLRMSLFIPPFLSTLDVLWYLRTRCQRSRRQDSVVAPSPAGEGDGWVDWSGLATLMATYGQALTSSVASLLAATSHVERIPGAVR
jgi:hypothetical protein